MASDPESSDPRLCAAPQAVGGGGWGWGRRSGPGLGRSSFPRVRVPGAPPAELVSLLPCGCLLQRLLLMLEELNNYNNDGKIEMAFPAEQKLKTPGSFPHPPYCSWPCIPTAPGTGWLGLRLATLSCGREGAPGTLGEFQESLQESPSPNVRLRNKSRTDSLFCLTWLHSEAS